MVSGVMANKRLDLFAEDIIFFFTMPEVGQFDDAEDPTPDSRSGLPYIDTSTYDSDDFPLPDASDEEDEIDEAYDENRVEDEDWEVAERGSLCHLSPSLEINSSEVG